MKALIILFFAVLASLRAFPQKLIEYREYDRDVMNRKVAYQYDNDCLVSVTETSFNPVPGYNSIYFRKYNVQIHEQEIDTIEIGFSLSLPEDSRDTMIYVKTYGRNGTIIKSSLYLNTNGESEMIDQEIFDGMGRLSKRIHGDKSWAEYSYDSKNRKVGTRSSSLNETANFLIGVDTVLFSDDERNATEIHYRIVDGRIVQKDTVSVSEFDKHGRIISCEKGKVVNSDSIHSQKNRIIFRYGWNGRLKEETELVRFYKTPFEKQSRTKYRYRHGLMTREQHYAYSDGKWVALRETKYKYDLRKRVLLEQTDYHSNESISNRKVWVYE